MAEFWGAYFLGFISAAVFFAVFGRKENGQTEWQRSAEEHPQVAALAFSSTMADNLFKGVCEKKLPVEVLDMAKWPESYKIGVVANLCRAVPKIDNETLEASLKYIEKHLANHRLAWEARAYLHFNPSSDAQ